MHSQINKPVILWLLIYNALIFCACFSDNILFCAHATDQTRGGAWQHGGWTAQGYIQTPWCVRPALRAHASLPVSLLPQPAGSAHQPADRVAYWNQPQKVCVSYRCYPSVTLWKWPSDLALKTCHLSHSQGGNMGSLRVGAEHRSSPASNGPAVDAGWWSERRRAAAARTDPVHAAAARSASQPAAGQLPPAARDHTAPHGRRLTHWFKSFGIV